MNREVQSVLKESSESSAFKFLLQDSNRSAVSSLAVLNERSFPEMKGWLDKRNNALPFNWHARWVIVKESFFLWNDIEVDCGNPTKKAERNKFKHMSLLQVESVQRIDSGKNKRKFKVVVNIGDKKKEYMWRCENEVQRNKWVLDLQYRVEHAKNVVDFLSDDVVDQY